MTGQMPSIWSLVGLVWIMRAFLLRKVTMARLFILIIVPIRRVHYLLDNVLDLRTIIVIADIYRGLYSLAKQVNSLHPPYLTFRHRSGVTPYTSTFVFAGSCVFDKQSAGNLSLRPRTSRKMRDVNKK